MRNEIQVNLSRLVGQRVRFTGTVKYRRPKHTTNRRVIGRPRKEEILLTNVRLLNSGQLVLKQLWKDAGAWSRELKVGDRIAFDATVATYNEKSVISSWGSCTLNRLRIVDVSPSVG